MDREPSAKPFVAAAEAGAKVSLLEAPYRAPDEGPGDEGERSAARHFRPAL
jgi:hypothetical protein